MRAESTIPEAAPTGATEAVRAQRRAAWQQYWDSGVLHSCPGSFGAGYDGTIGQFWRDTLRRCALRGRGPLRVVDLATGNGVLPRMLLEQGAVHGLALRIDAVDLSTAHPPALQGLGEAVRHHPGTDLCALPFDDGHFDLVVSQFGFEYAPRAEALRECRRVLAPEGAVAMMLHHHDSVIARVSRAERAHAGWVLGESGLLEAADTLLRLDGAPQAELQAAAVRMQQALQALQARAAAAVAPDLLHEVRQTLAGIVRARATHPAARCVEAVAQYRAALEAGAVRTQDMLDAALTPDDAQALAAALSAGRADPVECAVLAQREGVMGWGLRIGLPPG